MSQKSKANQQLEKFIRAERFLETIDILEKNIRQIKEAGQLAADGCYVTPNPR